MVISEVSVAESRGDDKGAMRICTVIILMVSVLTLSGSGCAPPPNGTLVPPDFEEISRIKKVGLCVKIERRFAVRLQYLSSADQSFLANLILFGVPIAVVLEFTPDKEDTRVLKPKAAQLDGARAIGSALLDVFETGKVFPAIELVASESLTSARERGIDALFIFTVRRWGLRPPLGSEYDKGDKAIAQLELDVNHTLVSSTTGKVLWKRNELYLDSESYSLGDFKQKDGLLGSRMERLLQLACDRTASEVH